MRIRKIRVRISLSKRGRAVAYTIVLVGLAVWLISGAWRNPSDMPGGHGSRIPLITLAVAVAAYLGVSAFEKLFSDDGEVVIRRSDLEN